MNLIVISLYGTLFTHCQVDERRRKQPKKQTISQPTNQPTKETNKQTKNWPSTVIGKSVICNNKCSDLFLTSFSPLFFFSICDIFSMGNADAIHDDQIISYNYHKQISQLMGHKTVI